MARTVNDTGVQGVEASRISRSEGLFRQLEDEIVGGQLPAGTRLGTKADLRDRFRVAVATVNEAVRMLEMRGLIEARPGPGGGLFVRSASPIVRLQHVTLKVSNVRAPTVRDSLAVRNALEPPLCAEAGRHHTKADLRTMESCLRRMEEATQPWDSLLANWDLHRVIADTTPNEVLRELYLALLALAEETLESVEFDDSTRSRQNRDHRELIDAIASRDQKRIAKAVSKHNALNLLEGSS